MGEWQPPPRNAVGNTLLMTLLLPAFVLVVVNLNPALRSTSGMFATAEKSNDEKADVNSACANAKKRAAGSPRHVQEFFETKTFKTTDDFRDECVAAVFEPKEFIPNPSEKDYAKEENYKCVGRGARVSEVQRQKGAKTSYVNVHLETNLKNKPGTCSVVYCKSHAECIAGKFSGVSDDIGKLADPNNSVRKEMEAGGLLKSTKLDEGQFSFNPSAERLMLDEALAKAGCESTAECPSIVESMKRRESQLERQDEFEKYMNTLFDKNEIMSSNQPARPPTLLAGLGDQEMLSYSLPTGSLYRPDTKTFDQYVYGNTTGFSTANLAPHALSGVSGLQWGQIRFSI